MSKIIYQKFESANTIAVTLEHNGFKGGDLGHGGFVKIKIEDINSTHMELNNEHIEVIELTFRGDSERYTLLNALKMIVKELDDNKTIFDI